MHPADLEASVALHEGFKTCADERVLIGDRDLNLGGHRRHDPHKAATSVAIDTSMFIVSSGVGDPAGLEHATYGLENSYAACLLLSIQTVTHPICDLVAAPLQM